MHCMTHNTFGGGNHCGSQSDQPHCNSRMARWFGRRWQKRRQQRRDKLATTLGLDADQREQFDALLSRWDDVRSQRINGMEALREPLFELLAEPPGSRNTAHNQLRSSLQARETELAELLNAFAELSEHLQPQQRATLLSQLQGYRG